LSTRVSVFWVASTVISQLTLAMMGSIVTPTLSVCISLENDTLAALSACPATMSVDDQ
jgi:hypothetical protein